MKRGLQSAPVELGTSKDGDCRATDNLIISSWYFSREEIENNSPSRKDGIELSKESELRTMYCSFLQDVGMKLRVPQMTISTAMMFCHRFYLHQSLAKNDWQTIATACLFLASKVEDTPCFLDKVVKVAYETIYKTAPSSACRIKEKDVFRRQKELILMAETMVLCNTRFDNNIQHPYKPLHQSFKKLGITQKDVRQVAWNFVNDWLRTTLCLQYKPHYIAAGSLYLASKVCNVKLPSGKGYAWWHEFEVLPRQLDVVIRQMVELSSHKTDPAATSIPKVPDPVKTPSETKEDLSCSPDSCVLNRPDSSRTISSHDPAGATDTSISESPSCVANDCPEVLNASETVPKIDIRRIKTLINARKRERSNSKRKEEDLNDLSEDAWIEKEVENGIESTDTNKKQRLI